MNTKKLNTKFVSKSFRLPKNLFVELDEICSFREIKKADFVRDAIKEKLHRVSIEENLSINIDSHNIESILNEYKSTLDKKINLFEDVIRSLSSGINSQFDNLNTSLQLILDSTILPAELLVTDRLTTRERILELLPIIQDDLYFEFDNIDDVNTTLDQLLKDNIIQINKKTGEIVKL